MLLLIDTHKISEESVFSHVSKSGISAVGAAAQAVKSSKRMDVVVIFVVIIRYCWICCHLYCWFSLDHYHALTR
jgi:hypothetical protein